MGKVDRITLQSKRTSPGKGACLAAEAISGDRGISTCPVPKNAVQGRIRQNSGNPLGLPLFLRQLLTNFTQYRAAHFGDVNVSFCLGLLDTELQNGNQLLFRFLRILRKNHHFFLRIKHNHSPLTIPSAREAAASSVSLACRVH